MKCRTYQEFCKKIQEVEKVEDTHEIGCAYKICVFIAAIEPKNINEENFDEVVQRIEAFS
mgnify:CR=1 FL=1